MKLLAVHTCPVWELPDGSQKIGMSEWQGKWRNAPVVGWVNVLVLRLFGHEYKLLAADCEEPASQKCTCTYHSGDDLDCPRHGIEA